MDRHPLSAAPTLKQQQGETPECVAPRVLLVAPQPFFEARGTPLNVLHMLRALASAGMDVHLATYGLGRDVPIPGVTCHRTGRLPGISHVRPGFSWQKVAMDVLLALRVWRLLAARRFDVVHAVEESVFFALPAARLARTPVIYDLDSSISEQLLHSGVVTRPWLLRFVERVERAALDRSAMAITVCRALTERVRELHASVPISQIEDAPLEEVLVGPDPARVDELRTELGLGAAPVAVYTGNLEAYQGIDLLMRSLPILTRRCPEARVLLVGGEPDEISAMERELDRKKLRSLVVFAGKLPPQRMADIMALGAALVSPRTEGTNTPLKLYSYMHSAVPIVATDLPTHRQVLDDRIAVLCAPTPEGMGAALADVLGNPAAFAARGVAARERVTTHYGRDVLRQKLLAAYAQVLPGYDAERGCFSSTAMRMNPSANGSSASSAAKARIAG